MGKPEEMKDFVSYVSNWAPGTNWLSEQDNLDKKYEKREKAVRELLERRNIPFNADMVDEHVQGIEDLMYLSSDQYETFEEALDAWAELDNFDDINNKRRGGKKKKKKTRRKRKKKKKKTRTKK